MQTAPVIPSLPPRVLETPTYLRDAVRIVISQNEGGRPATIFAEATQYGDAPDLVSVCSSFINKGETLAYVENELRNFPYMRTIEDFVCRYGSTWGFNQSTINTACGRVEYFNNQVAGFIRYI